MYYEINVSRYGIHVFATAERSCSTYARATELYGLFTELFKEIDGYKVSIWRVDVTHERVDINV